MHHVSVQGVDERMINVNSSSYYYYYYYLQHLLVGNMFTSQLKGYPLSCQLPGVRLCTEKPLNWSKFGNMCTYFSHAHVWVFSSGPGHRSRTAVLGSTLRSSVWLVRVVLPFHPAVFSLWTMKQLGSDNLLPIFGDFQCFLIKLHSCHHFFFFLSPPPPHFSTSSSSSSSSFIFWLFVSFFPFFTQCLMEVSW